MHHYLISGGRGSTLEAGGFEHYHNGVAAISLRAPINEQTPRSGSQTANTLTNCGWAG